VRRGECNKRVGQGAGKQHWNSNRGRANLARCVPYLKLDRLAVHFAHARAELDADCVGRVCQELLVCELQAG